MPTRSKFLRHAGISAAVRALEPIPAGDREFASGETDISVHLAARACRGSTFTVTLRKRAAT